MRFFHPGLTGFRYKLWRGSRTKLFLTTCNGHATLTVCTETAVYVRTTACKQSIARSSRTVTNGIPIQIDPKKQLLQSTIESLRVFRQSLGSARDLRQVQTKHDTCRSVSLFDRGHAYAHRQRPAIVTTRSLALPSSQLQSYDICQLQSVAWHAALGRRLCVTAIPWPDSLHLPLP